MGPVTFSVPRGAKGRDRSVNRLGVQCKGVNTDFRGWGSLYTWCRPELALQLLVHRHTEKPS